jgi:hypothetical protein
MKGFNTTNVTDFAEYCARAIPKLVFTPAAASPTCQFPKDHAKHMEHLRSFSEADFRDLEVQHCRQQPDLARIRAMYALRCMAGELVEDLIAIDRLLFLSEHAGVSAVLEPLFDPNMSPRNFVIVAHKNKLEEKLMPHSPNL